MGDMARLGLLVTCLIATYVGVRTLLIWRRTRMVPELMIGLNVLGLSIGGVVLTIMGDATLTTQTFAPFTFGLGCLVLHTSALFVGNWKIFRPDARWAALLSCGAIVTTSLWAVWALEMPETSWERTIYYVNIRLVGQAWSTYECVRYSRMLNRRAELGLADPMLAHRIWLWGMGAVAQVIVLLCEVGAWYKTGGALVSSPTGLHITSVLGLSGITAVYLAFFPPAAYVRFIEGRRARAGSFA